MMRADQYADRAEVHLRTAEIAQEHDDNDGRDYYLARAQVCATLAAAAAVDDLRVMGGLTVEVVHQ